MKSDYFWKESELDVLKKFGPKLQAKDLKKKLPNKSIHAIYAKRIQLGIKAPGVGEKWSAEEIEILKKYGSKLTARELEKKLPGRSGNRIGRKRKELNIRPSDGYKKKSTKEEDEIIKKFSHLLDKDIAKKLSGRSKNFVRSRRLQLGIRKRLDKYPFPKFFEKWFNKNLNHNKSLNEFSFNYDPEINLTLQCPKNKKHIITKSIKNFRLSFDKFKKINCPYCKGYETIKEESLQGKYPLLAKNFSKKNTVTPDNVHFKTFKRYLFKCDKGHENLHYIKYLTCGGNKDDKPRKDYIYECEKCKNPILKDSKELKPFINIKKNNNKILNNVRINNNKIKIWVKACDDPTHTWQITPSTLKQKLKGVRGKFTCSFCVGKSINQSNNLFDKLQKSQLIFSKKNKSNPKKIFYHSIKSYYFECKSKGHIFKKPAAWIYDKKDNIPICRICEIEDRSLKKLYPDIYNQIDFKKNKGIIFEELSSRNNQTLWWICNNNSTHPSYQQKISQRTIRNIGCKLCAEKTGNLVWDKDTVRLFLKSIRDHIHSLTPAEKFLIFQQTGMPSKSSSSYKFIKDFASGKIPVDEIDKFIEGKNNSIDSTIVNIEKEEAQISNDDVLIKPSGQAAKETVQIINETNVEQGNDKNFPEVSTKQVLKTLSYLVRNVNQEAIEFLIASAKHKIWRDVFQNETKAIKELKQYSNDEYVKRVQFEFLNEYKRAIKIKEPKGYSFKYPPKLMQKLTAAKIIHERRVGNWSGTGAGKTLSAILASRCVGSKNTVVCCPNALAQDMKAGWGFEIMNIFPDSNVRLKSFEPLDTESNNYYVLNYEAFQQKNSSKKILEFLKKVKVDFVIIDEIHYSKQRQVENLSERKKNITSMLAEIQKKNKKLHVLGMSATPVINNLFEGRSLVEMITGEVHKDLPTKVNINNCMKLHQKLTTVGLRYMPDYKMKLKTTIEDIDCSHITDQVKELGKHPTPLELEKLLTREKMNTIKKHVEPKTLIYTHYLDDIADYIKEELEKDGYKVGFFTGEDKSGLDEFKNGSLDILIGSRTVGTGVNGLQDVCRKIIINSLPWTNAEYEQLIGRVYREGQRRDVEIVIPLTEGTVNGQQWSWCKSRYDRIKFKKTVGDAAVDGVIPSEEIRTESQVLQDLMKWIDRISGDDDFEIKREPIKSEFTFDSTDEVKRIAKYGDFSRMNREWNNSKSITTHEKIKKNPDLWKHYHQMFEENKKKWTVVPTTELIRFFKSREGYEIGDFGCGKAILHEQLSNKHTIHSFDHYACNQYVTACDISKTTLNDKQLDFAVFSLSMMGSNIADYITEANRTLKLDGGLFIIEATSRFKDLDQFKRQLIQFGFDYLSVKEMGKFTQIKADKVKDIDPKNKLELKF